MDKKIAIIGAGADTSIIREVLRSEEHEAVFIEEVKTNPAFDPEPITITARPFLVDFDYPIFDPPKSKYIPNRKKK